MTDSRSSSTDRPDALGQLASIAPDSPVAAILASRPTIAGNAQRSYETLLAPEDPAGVSRYERALLALRVAVLTPSPAVVERQRAQLRQLGAGEDAIRAIEGFPDGGELPPRQAALLRFTDLLTVTPAAASPADIAALKTAGFGPRDIVTIAQLISFESFEVRALAGIRLLQEAT